MRPIHLSFNRSIIHQWLGHASAPWSRGLVTACAIIAVAALAGACWSLLDLQSSARHASDLLRKAQQQAAPLVRPAASSRLGLQPAQIVAINRTIVQLNAPWTAVFAGLEACWTPDVALVSIEPDMPHGRVRLVAEAKELETLYRYAQNLGNTAPFTRASFVKHEVQGQDAIKPVRLTLELSLRQTSSLAEPTP